MTLTKPLARDARQKDILFRVVAEIETHIAQPELPDELAPDAVKKFRWFGVRYQPNVWFGRQQSPGERMAYSRATRRLERDQLVRRVTEKYRDRTVFLQPTLGGVLCVFNLAEGHLCLGDFVRGLSDTDWGQKLADQMERSFPNLLQKETLSYIAADSTGVGASAREVGPATI